MAESCNRTPPIADDLKSQTATSSYEFVTNNIVVPVELAVGFACQICNLLVLHGSNIKRLAYTTYLKALSINYMISILFLVPSLLRKNELLDRQSYVIMFYHAHLEQYCANLFLISGNLIIVAMAAEALRAVLFPLHALTTTNRRRRHSIVLAVVYATAMVVILPTTVVMRLDKEYYHSPPLSKNASARTAPTAWRYCSRHVRKEWINALRYVSAAVFEVFLILFILLIYAAVLMKFRSIVRQHRDCVRQLTQTPGRLLSSSHRKATVICLASVTAFLICNFPSALLETVYLISYVKHDLRTFWRSEARGLLRDTGNMMLAFNFSLTFLLQYAASVQFRKEFHRLIRKGKLSLKASMSSTRRKGQHQRCPSSSLERRL